MRSSTRIIPWKGGLFLLFLLAIPLHGEDLRKGPINMYLIIDTSFAMEGHLPEALSWVNSVFLQGLNCPGDTITVWTAGATPAFVTQIIIQQPEDLKNLQTLIQSLSIQKENPDYVAALKLAVQAEKDRKNQEPIAFALLLSGTGVMLSGKNSSSSELAALLRYSKVEDFDGWKAIVVGLGVEQRVEEATKSYMKYIQSIRITNP